MSDPSTLALYHFDEASGTYVNSGTGGTSLDLTDTGGTNGRDNSAANGGVYGETAFSGFGSSADILRSGSNSHHTSGSTVGGGLLTTAAVLQSSLQGTSGAFTYEALIKISGTSLEQEIIAQDGANGSRGFLFRVTGGDLSLFADSATGTTNFAFKIPDTGNHAFVANEWFHVAVTYSGAENVNNNLKFYWTALSSTATEANLLFQAKLASDLSGSSDSNKLGIGGTTRGVYRFETAGLVDEVRISSIARTADQFVFVPEPSSFTLLGLGLLTTACLRKRSN